MNLKINCGSGQRKFGPDWINVDKNPKWEPDYVADGAVMPMFSDNSADIIVLHHVLEHFGCGESAALIAECHRILKPGGSLLVFVPDMAELARMWQEGVISTQVYLTNVYGAYMDDEADRHKWAGDAESWTAELGKSGKFSVKAFDWRSVEGADIARDRWILGLEAVKVAPKPFGHILTIARNNLHLTRKAVASFEKQDINVEILVLDNASTDGTADWLKTQPVARIPYPRQKSVAECWNRGLNYLFGQGAEHVLVCNNDVELRPDTYRLLLEHGGPFVTGVGVNNRKQMAEIDPKTERNNPDYSCWMIRSSCWEQFKGDTLGFDERCKIAFCEDSFGHVRLHRLGIPAVCIGVPFYHEGSATVKHADPDERDRICQQADLNRELFYQTYGVRIGTPEYDTLFTPETFGIDSPAKTL